jgi:hypothetical protein
MRRQAIMGTYVLYEQVFSCQPGSILGSVFALVEAYLYAGIWSVLSGPRLGQRLAATRFGRWIERKASRKGGS